MKLWQRLFTAFLKRFHLMRFFGRSQSFKELHQSSYAKEISKGNLVYWGFVEQVTDKNHSGIEAIGHVLAILYPEFNPNNGKWTVKNDLTS